MSFKEAVYTNTPWRCQCGESHQALAGPKPEWWVIRWLEPRGQNRCQPAHDLEPESYPAIHAYPDVLAFGYTKAEALAAAKGQ